MNKQYALERILQHILPFLSIQFPALSAISRKLLWLCWLYIYIPTKLSSCRMRLISV